ncbi:MAG: substrate-binding periplasmic protein [Aestuariibacter sp.]
MLTKVARQKNLIVILSFILLVSFNTRANVKASAKQSIYAVTELFYPFQQLDEDHRLIGYSVDVVRALSRLANDELYIELLPWAVAYNKSLKHPNTMIFSIGKNAEREKLFHWVGRLTKEELYFWALPNSHITPSSIINDFKPFTITVVKEATTHQYLRSNGFENLYVMGATESNTGEEQRIEMVINGRADIVISSQENMSDALSKLGYAPDVLTRVFRASVLDSELYVAFGPETDTLIVERYRNAYQQLRSSGEFNKIQKQWKIE